MAVDTILNTATPLQPTQPSAIRQTNLNAIQKKTKNEKLSNIVIGTETGINGDQACDIIKRDKPESPDRKSNQKSDALKDHTKTLKSNRESHNVKSDKTKEPGQRCNNGVKANKTNATPTIATKPKDGVKNTKAPTESKPDSRGNKTKELQGDKNTKNISGKRINREDDVSSDESCTEYVTFDEYLDRMANGKVPERKHCFHRSTDDSLDVPLKPSSSSSSISSISTININETPSSPGLENSMFDSKIFRTSLVEASEISRHEVLHHYFFKEREIDSDNVCAWSPSITTSPSSYLKSHMPKFNSKRLNYQQNTLNPPRIQRSLSMTQKEDNPNNSFTVPAVYDRLVNLGRYREFCFEHHPDDWQWYMKEYNATQTVGRVGVRKKKKQLKFGINAPDPYATMGKKVVSSSGNFDSRQNTVIQEPSKERQPRKSKNGDESNTSCPTKDKEENETRKERNYPVLATTREANQPNTNAGKTSKSEKVGSKSTSSDAAGEKQQNTSHNKNKTSTGNNKARSRGQHQQPANKSHSTYLHLQHPGVPHLSGDDVKLSLTSSKITHQRDPDEYMDDVIEGDIEEEEEEEEEKLWQNPFQSPTRTRVTALSRSGVGDVCSRKSRDAQNEEIVHNNHNEGLSGVSVQPSGSNSTQCKIKLTENSSSKYGDVDVKTPSRHLKAELERENDGSLMVKISVFNTNMTKVDTPTNSNSGGKSKKTVRIFREESMLMGRELHEKLKSLNQGELTRNDLNGVNGEQDQKSVTDNKRGINNITENRHTENESKTSVKKKVRKSSNKERALELQGRECKTKKFTSISVSKEKIGDESSLELDGDKDVYPRHRTAYQEIEYTGSNSLRAKPTIKYMKSKLNESERIASQTKDEKPEKGPLRQTMLIRSSTVHLASEVETENVSNVIDSMPDRNVHQVYPLNDWKESADQGKCGFIVKSFPTDSQELERKATVTINAEQNGNNHKSLDYKDDSNIYKNSFDSTAATHLDISNNSSHLITDDGIKQSKTFSKPRPLFRPKPELPSIKVSVNDHNDNIKDAPPSTNIKTYHFPPIHPTDNSDKQKALDDLFVSGINHDRSGHRDTSFVARKRPVSLDRGLIDDLVRYQTETSSIGLKIQPTSIQTHLQLSHPHHPTTHHHHPASNHHHHSFLTNHANLMPFKTQPEESPSLMPSVQKINKVSSNLRPRPKSQREDRKLTSSLTESRELDLKRQIQIYAHVRKTHNASSPHDGVSSNNDDKSPTVTKPPSHLPDFQHFLKLDKDNKLT